MSMKEVKSMKEVNEIRSQIEQLRKKQKEAEERLSDAGLRAIGLSIGDRIKTPSVIVEVAGCSAGWGVPRPYGYKVKKDGAVGSQIAGYIDKWELM